MSSAINKHTSSKNSATDGWKRYTSVKAISGGWQTMKKTIYIYYKQYTPNQRIYGYSENKYDTEPQGYIKHNKCYRSNESFCSDISKYQYVADYLYFNAHLPQFYQ